MSTPAPEAEALQDSSTIVDPPPTALLEAKYHSNDELAAAARRALEVIRSSIRVYPITKLLGPAERGVFSKSGGISNLVCLVDGITRAFPEAAPHEEALGMLLDSMALLAQFGLS